MSKFSSLKKIEATYEIIWDKMYNFGRGLMEEAGEDFSMSVDEFVEVLLDGSDVHDFQWKAIGRDAPGHRRMLAKQVAEKLL